MSLDSEQNIIVSADAFLPKGRADAEIHFDRAATRHLGKPVMSRPRAAQAIVLSAVFTLASSSCYRRVGIVEAISSGAPFSRAYFLVPGDPGVSIDDLEFRDISRHVHGVLQELGYQPAATIQEAGLLIRVKYEVSGPFTQHEQMTIPVTQYVPGKSYTVNGTRSRGGEQRRG